MTQPGEPAPGPAEAHALHAPAPLPFSGTEWQDFRKTDKAAGAYIVGLMAGIFVVGVLLYLIVLWSVVA